MPVYRTGVGIYAVQQLQQRNASGCTGGAVNVAGTVYGLHSSYVGSMTERVVSKPVSAIGMSDGPGLSAVSRFFKGLFDASLTFYQSINAAAAGTAALTRVSTFARALAATATGVAGLAWAATYFRSLTAAATGVSTLASAALISQVLSAAATGVSTLSRIFTYVKTLGATAAGVAGLAARATFSTAMAAVAAGVAGLATMFIGGGGGNGRTRGAAIVIISCLGIVAVLWMLGML